MELALKTVLAESIKKSLRESPETLNCVEKELNLFAWIAAPSSILSEKSLFVARNSP